MSGLSRAAALGKPIYGLRRTYLYADISACSEKGNWWPTELHEPSALLSHATATLAWQARHTTEGASA